MDHRLFGKAGALDPEQFRAMADHTRVGHQIVRSVKFPWPNIPETVRWHHERSDGSGYPDKLTLEEVRLPGSHRGRCRFLRRHDQPRPYRAPMSVGSALSDLVRLAAERFDPNIRQALLIQVGRDVIGSSRVPRLEGTRANIAASDIDQLAATLQ